MLLLHVYPYLYRIYKKLFQQLNNCFQNDKIFFKHILRNIYVTYKTSVFVSVYVKWFFFVKISFFFFTQKGSKIVVKYIYNYFN